MNPSDPSTQTDVDASSTPVFPDRYGGLPVVFPRGADGVTRPAPFLLNRGELVGLFRLHDRGTKFPDKTLQRYRRLGLKATRIGRGVWYRLDDVLRFLDCQQDRLSQLRR